MNIYPEQKNSITEKLTDDWAKSNADYFRSKCNDYTWQHREIITLLKAAEGQLDSNDYQYVLNPYNTSNDDLTRFPAKLRNYDIISPIINSWMGERIRMPHNYMVTIKNSDSPNKFKEDQFKVVEEYHAQQFINAANAGGMNTGMPSKEQPPIEEIMAKFTDNWNDGRAIIGQEALDYLKYNLIMDDKLQKAFYYWIVCGRFYTYRDIAFNDVGYDIPHPLEMFHSETHTGNIQDCSWVVRKRRAMINDVVDRFHDKLSEKDINWLQTQAQSTVNFANTNAITIQSEDFSRGWYHPFVNKGEVDLYHIVWTTFIQVGTLTYMNELGEMKTAPVSEDYVLNPEYGDISIKWEWINEKWELYQIGDDIRTKPQPLLCQQNEMNNTSVCKGCYGGKIQLTLNNQVKSEIKKGLSYQALFNIYHYKRELIINKNKDKITFLPLGMLPDSFGKDPMDKFMYYLEATSIGWLDETAENFVAIMQAIKQVDLSLYQYIEGINKVIASVKDEWWDSIGMNRQRYGDTMASDGKGVTEQAIFRSSIITTELFRSFDVGAESEYTALLNYSKVAWVGGKKSSYVNSDGKNAFLNIEDYLQYAESEFGVFVKDNAKESGKLDSLKQLTERIVAKPGVGTAIVAEIIDSDNFAKVKSLMKQADQLEQQYNQSVQDANNKSAQMLQDKKDADAQKDRDLKRYEIDTKAATTLQVAEFNSHKVMSVDTDSVDAELTALETQAKIEIDKRGLDLEQQRLNFEKNKSNREAAQTDEELKIKRIAANKPKGKA